MDHGLLAMVHRLPFKLNPFSFQEKGMPDSKKNSNRVNFP